MSEKIVKTGIGVIVIKDNKILTGIRAGSHGAGCRAFPGGHIEFDDNSLVESGKREVAEECGLEIEFREFRGGYDLFTTFDILSEDGQKRYVTVYMVADYVSGGDWLSETVIRGLEPNKCDKWKFHTFDQLTNLVSQEKNQTWIPINRIEIQREELRL